MRNLIVQKLHTPRDGAHYVRIRSWTPEVPRRGFVRYKKAAKKQNGGIQEGLVSKAWQDSKDDLHLDLEDGRKIVLSHTEVEEFQFHENDSQIDRWTSVV